MSSHTSLPDFENDFWMLLYPSAPFAFPGKVKQSSYQFFYFLLFHISFYYNHLLQLFTTSFNIIGKKEFCDEFSFFNGFTHPFLSPTSQPLNAQNLLSVTWVFCQCSLYMFLYFFISLICKYVWRTKTPSSCT